MIDFSQILVALQPFFTSEAVNLFMAMIYAVVGKWASGTPFDSHKFLKTMAIGAVLGVLTASTGWTPEEIQTWLAGFGGIYGLDKGLTIVLGYFEKVYKK